MAEIIDTNKVRTDIYVKPDGERRQQVYIYYRDFNGIYTIENTDGTNPYWQSDYAWVHFTYIPPGNRAYEGKSVYLFGELTNYAPDEASRMIFNEEKGVYEKALFLKQGYYNYSYVTLTDKKHWRFHSFTGKYRRQLLGNREWLHGAGVFPSFRSQGR